MKVGQRVQLEQATGTLRQISASAEVEWDTGACCSVPLHWLSPAPGCEECGGSMEAVRSTRKYCSSPCRQKAYRRYGKQRVGKDTSKGTNGRERATGSVR